MTTYNSVIDRTDAAALIPEDAARQIVQGATEQSAVMRLARRLPDLARASSASRFCLPCPSPTS